MSGRPVALAALLLPAAASAHEATDAGWTFDPWIVVPLVLAASLYALGASRILARSSIARVHRRRALWFAAGWLSLAGALVSPLHEAGERSFAAHMLEHEILMLVAAPMLVLARPLGTFAWALPRAAASAVGSLSRGRTFSTIWSALTAPVPATLMQSAALWLWHAPPLFELALARPGWHVVQHLSFFASALAFWTGVLDEHRLQKRPGVAIACLFATALTTGALGALMALSASPWYAAYRALGLTPEGLTPAEDQELAGLLMWIPGGLVHTAAALLIAFRLLSASRARPGSGVPVATRSYRGA
jgi:cytochrome c oxidase assembly factor CtaG